MSRKKTLDRITFLVNILVALPVFGLIDRTSASQCRAEGASYWEYWEYWECYGRPMQYS